jgi:TolA-binding protein
MNENLQIIISALLGTGGIATIIVSWFLSRRKNTADIMQSLTSAAMSITDTNERLLNTLNVRIASLEDDILKLTQQNKILAEQNSSLLRRLSDIGDLVLKTTGENVSKAAIARLLK